MTLDKNEVQIIVQERAKLQSVDAAIRELEEYGNINKGRLWGAVNSDYENILLERNDKLINLSLAKYATDEKVFLSLYNKACEQEKSKNNTYYKALKVCCLSNSNNQVWRPLLGENDWLKNVEELLYTDANYEEKLAILRNPSLSRKTLARLLRKEAPFESMSANIWFQMLAELIKNEEFFNTDESNHEHPDRDLWDLQKAISKFLEITPKLLEKNISGFFVTRDLLGLLNPELHSSCENYERIIKEWQAIKLPEKEEIIKMVLEETICLIPALFGAGKSSLSSKDIALRYAYYGNKKLSVAEIRKGCAKDYCQFTEAALRNCSLYYDNKTRAALEECIGGARVYTYRRICIQISKQNSDFDSAPITEHGREAFKEAFNETSPQISAIEKVISQNNALVARLDKYEKSIKWVIIVLIIVFFWLTRH